MSSASSERLLSKAAAVVCELSHGQADALASDIAAYDAPAKIRQVVGLEAPRSVKELGALWVAESALEPTALADAIRCAARAVKTVSSYEKVELLYTGPDSDELRRNLQGLLEVIRGAHQSLWIVSYLVLGVDDILKALHERSESANGVEVRVLLDHKKSGEFEAAIRRISQLAPGCSVYIWPDESRHIDGKTPAALHAKCAVADGRQAFVSSANLTGKAMDRNLEVGYLVTGGPTPRQLAAHFDELLTSGMIELVRV